MSTKYASYDVVSIKLVPAEMATNGTMVENGTPLQNGKDYKVELSKDSNEHPVMTLTMKTKVQTALLLTYKVTVDLDRIEDTFTNQVKTGSTETSGMMKPLVLRIQENDDILSPVVLIYEINTL